MCLLQLFHTRARPEAYQYNNWSAPLCCWKYLSPTYQTKHLQWKATFPGFLLEFFLLKTCLFTDTHTNKPECVCSHACIHTHTSSFQGIRWIFVSLLPKINVARCVIVWARSHTCALYAFVCVFSLLSLHSYNLPTSPAICSPPVSSLSLSVCLSPLRSHLPLSLSPMNRLNFLMSCFYGLLMLIHSSPYALSLASVHLSVSLDSSIHPHPPTLFCPALLLQQYLYLQALKYTPVNTFTVTCAIPRCARPVKRYTRGNLRAYFWIQLKFSLRWCD